MCMACSVGYGVTAGAIALASSTAAPLPSIDPANYSSLRQTIKNISLPDIDQPAWLKKQLSQEVAATQAAQARKAASTITVTYDIATKGALYASVSEFKLLANQTLNDSRGWARMNVRFVEVASGGMFSLVLSEASQLPSFSSGCSAEYSCRVGRNVVINQDRWMEATPSWNNGGGSLRDYRHMVVNHETGHWLGHGHTDCGGAGQPAAVMQQQSINLQGCSFNPWPLPGELWSTQLGI
jgi:hypothetical protein